MRTLFFGTPELAVPSLDALHRISEIALVISQPDKPKGRGLAVTPTPVKARALELGLPVEQPTKVRTPELAARLTSIGADVALVIAYGRILPLGILSAPRLGCVNVHASLLPRYRGAAPIQWAIVDGNAETGVCLMQMDEGMDTGAVIACERTPIAENETAGELGPRLAAIGASLVERDLPRYVRGELHATAQDHGAATMAPLLEKDHGRIDFAQRARAVHDRARGMTPWPGAFAFARGERVKLFATRVGEETGSHGEPGTILAIDGDGARVACSPGIVVIGEMQLEGRKRMRAVDIASGRALQVGDRLTS